MADRSGKIESFDFVQGDSRVKLTIEGELGLISGATADSSDVQNVAMLQRAFGTLEAAIGATVTFDTTTISGNTWFSHIKIER